MKIRTLIQEDSSHCSPETLARRLRGEPGLVLLRSASLGPARYSLLTCRPFLTFRSSGPRCELSSNRTNSVQFGNPWQIMERCLARYELPDDVDLPFPLGGCFGFWGYDLKNFVEPRVTRRAVRDIELPDCAIGFYDSLVVFDHYLERTCIVSTGLREDGARDPAWARKRLAWWQSRINPSEGAPLQAEPCRQNRPLTGRTGMNSSLSKGAFLERVEKARQYIHRGDIYQVNLSHRLHVEWPEDAWVLYERLAAVSPAPFAGYFDGGDFELISSSPELFLRLSGLSVHTRPIKGTRPRSQDPLRDAQLAHELQTSAKEISELVMITDLLRNDLGRVCEFGSIHVPELMKLERYAQVQHLVSTVDGRLRPDATHLSAFVACFPGGSITGAPKIRAMEIIDELEPTARGPYTGCLGYLGFNRESQLGILIRSAVCKDGQVWFQVGAGIVNDSDPEAEYEETMAKAKGFLAALDHSAKLAVVDL